MRAPARRTLLGLAILLPPAAPAAANAPPTPTLSYSIDLNRRADDLFHVTLRVTGLGPNNAIYQFASTAPGTYQVMNIGRYVKAFVAYDAHGARRCRSSRSRSTSGALQPVAGAHHPLRHHGDLGQPAGPSDLQDVRHDARCRPRPDQPARGASGIRRACRPTPVRLRLAYPAAWKVGTALHRGPDGVYVADSYDQLVDSPILLGRLTRGAAGGDRCAGRRLRLLRDRQDQGDASCSSAMSGMLNAAGKFLGKLPVDRYTFLYHFGDQCAGAWEHSYSSEYVLHEGEFTDSVGKQVTDIAAHEFFHIVTPLNIHSEIIEHFNFVTPVPSQHLWLYEGTTEWAAHAMQLRAGLKTPEEYLATQIKKMQIDRQAYDSTYSLRELALTSYSDSGQAQYGNIYMRGALTAGLLDIRLLELSHGQRGLQDLIVELAHHYGKRRAFPDSTFVDTLVAMTYPEIRDFFDRYVWGSQHLPIKEYYAKLGITLVEDDKGQPVRFEIDPNPTDEQRLLREAWLGRKPHTSS